MSRSRKDNVPIDVTRLDIAQTLRLIREQDNVGRDKIIGFHTDDIAYASILSWNLDESVCYGAS